MANDPQFCSNCGARNEADATFCESCGQTLEAAAEPAAEPTAATPRRRVPRKVLGLLGVATLLAGTAVAFPAPIAGFLSSILPGKGANPQVAAQPPVPLGDVPVPPVAIPISPPRGASAAAPAQRVARPTPRTTQSTGRPTAEVPAPPPPPPPAPLPPPPPPPSSDDAPIRGIPGRVPATTEPPANPPLMPGPAPSPPAAPAGRIAAGSVLSLRATSQLCTDKSKIGDRVKASLERSVAGSDGVALPQGALVTFVVDQLKRGDEQTKQNTIFSVAAESIELGGMSYPLSAKVDTVVLKRKGRGLLGALVGAAAGVAATKAAGGSTSEAVAVGAAGGVAGAVVGSQLQHGDGCIEKNGLLRITLREDLIPGAR